MATHPLRIGGNKMDLIAEIAVTLRGNGARRLRYLIPDVALTGMILPSLSKVSSSTQTERR